MKKICISLALIVFFIQVCYATTETVTDDRVIYRTLSNISSNIPRQARILLRLKEYYPGRAAYQISFSSDDTVYGTVYRPGDDTLVITASRTYRYRTPYTRREVEYSELIKKQVYAGRVQERLLRARDQGVAELALDDDVVTEEDLTIVYETPEKAAAKK